MAEFNAQATVDNIVGTNGNDLFNVSPYSLQKGDYFDGAGGINEIYTTLVGSEFFHNDYDFTGTTLKNFQRLSFGENWNSSSYYRVYFQSSQFGEGLSNNLLVTGAPSYASPHEEIHVSLSQSGSFSAAGWTFSSWSGEVFLNGTNGVDTITAATSTTTITGGGGGDYLFGGAGADTFRDSAANLNGDTIYNFDKNDSIVISDADPSHFTFSLSGNTLNYGGGSLTIKSDKALHLKTVPYQYNGVQLVIDKDWKPSSPVQNDFNGDGHSDILWQNANGTVSTWSSIGSGSGDTIIKSAFNAPVDPSWHAIDSFDWNGDGRSDILWHNQDGSVAVWDAASSGFDTNAYYHRPVTNGWAIAGAGDLNGDGKGDLLWQNSDGSISTWLGTGTAFQENAYFHASVGTSWKIAGVGDFNGDGREDILWRNVDGSVSTWDSTGSRFQEGSFFQSGVATSWHIDGIGDVNGDGRADIAWRNDDGSLAIWQGTASGSFVEGQSIATAPRDWHIEQVGDFNGDGLADLLWRSESGSLSVWHSNGASFDQNTYFDSSVGVDWHVAAHSFLP